MMTASPTHSKVNQLKLIWNNSNGLPSQEQHFVLSELIGCIIQSLDGADLESRVKLENILTRIGVPAIPFLLEGLQSGSKAVQSVSFMVLVRVGQPAVKQIQAFYKQAQGHDNYQWIVELLLQELNMQVPFTSKSSSRYASEPASGVLSLVAP